MHLPTEQELMEDRWAEVDEFLACADDNEVNDYLASHGIVLGKE